MPLIRPLAAPGSPGRFLGHISRLRLGSKLVGSHNNLLLALSDLYSIPQHHPYSPRLVE